MLQKLNKIKKHIMTPWELKYLKYRNRKVVKDSILLEAAQGREISGHIYYIAKKIKEEYPHINFFISLKKHGTVPEIFKDNIVEHMSDRYLQLLATSEILINDTSFWGFFNKRSEQKYYIFWHGTPLKCLGKSTQNQGYGNVQRNLASADKIFVNNKYSGEILLRDFGIKDIVHNEVVIAPSPRNSILLEPSKVVKGRYLYMPTWREKNIQDKNAIHDFRSILLEMDNLLKSDEELFIKLHPYEAEVIGLDKMKFEHIKIFPKEKEIYEFLQTVDKLITDYSSIMFDFFLTKRDILLFTYDEEEYLRTRKTYMRIENLPFKKVNTVVELFKQLRRSELVDYSKLEFSYAPMDCVDGTEIVCNYLFKEYLNEKIEIIDNWNGKENVLIYAGMFEENGITSSLFNLLNSIDLTKRNYIITWQENTIDTNNEYKIKNLPEGVHTFIGFGKLQSTLLEMVETFFYMNEHFHFKKSIVRMFVQDFNRLFPNTMISHFIHYQGYDRSYATWVEALKVQGVKTSIFVHTDIEREIKLNSYLKEKIIFNAYKEADNVVCVSSVIKNKIDHILPEANTKVVNVFFDKKFLLEQSNLEISECLPEKLLLDLYDNRIKVFINIGRFSRQKGLDRLIEAFEKLNLPNTRLLILGKYGPEKEAILKKAKDSSRSEDIYILDKINNPYNLLNKADCFVFSSRYEGLGMVVVESLLIGTPVITTKIPETLSILEENSAEGVMIVDSSTVGLISGLNNFISNPIETTFFDYGNYKKKSLESWEKIFK